MGATYAFGIGYHPQNYARWVKEGSRVFDIGANRGQSTLILCSLAGPSGKVVACEPVPEIFAYLIENLALNRFENVDARALAIADVEGESEFEYSPDFSTQGKISGVERTYVVGETSVIRVKTITLDCLVERTETIPEFIKVDVEGGARVVFEGGRTVLGKHRPVVFIELHGPEECSAVQWVLEEFGYRAENVKGEAVSNPRTGWHNPLILLPSADS